MEYMDNWNNLFPKKEKPTGGKIPNVKPIPLQGGLIAFTAIGLTGAAIGATIGTYVFFGTVMLTGLVVVIENNKYLHYAAKHSNSVIDIGIFTATVVATANLGITVSAALTFAGLGYTLVYSPYLRAQKKRTS